MKRIAISEGFDPIYPGHIAMIENAAKYGEVRVNLPDVWHVLQVPVHQDMEVLEVQMGTSAEEDIEKISESDQEFEEEKLKKVHLNV